MSPASTPHQPTLIFWRKYWTGKPCSPTSRRYAPYAVVAGDSGVVCSSSSDTPQRAQNALCVSTSAMTFRIVSVADLIWANVDDFVASRLWTGQKHYGREAPRDGPVCAGVVSEVQVVLPGTVY